MATMIPLAIPDAPGPDRVVFDLLRDDPATDGWIVIHHLKDGGHDSEETCAETGPPESRRPAIDFLALVPGGAILLLEVNGGGFEVKKGQWYKAGSQELINPPGERAEEALWTLHDQLRRRFTQWAAQDELPMDGVVLFTDANWPPHLRPLMFPTVGLPELESRRQQTLGERLGEIAQEAREELPGGIELNEQTIAAIQQYLINSSD